MTMVAESDLQTWEGQGLEIRSSNMRNPIYKVRNKIYKHEKSVFFKQEQELETRLCALFASVKIHKGKVHRKKVKKSNKC